VITAMEPSERIVVSDRANPKMRLDREMVFPYHQLRSYHEGDF